MNREDNFPHLCEFTISRTPAVTCELNHSKQGLQDDPLKKTLIIKYVCVYIYIFIQEIYICAPLYIQIKLGLNFNPWKECCISIFFLKYKKLINLWPRQFQRHHQLFHVPRLQKAVIIEFYRTQTSKGTLLEFLNCSQHQQMILLVLEICLEADLGVRSCTQALAPRYSSLGTQLWNPQPCPCCWAFQTLLLLAYIQGRSKNTEVLLPCVLNNANRFICLSFYSVI